MLAHFSIPDTVRCRLTSLSRENFTLWAFIAQNDLFDEAEKFLNDSTYDKIFTRCLLVEGRGYDNLLPWEDEHDLPF